ncbi:exodeoxyribonuclease VII small subunit [bacterium]|nr:exodeoxyribonuclease VII small subunit [bacterium]
MAQEKNKISFEKAFEELEQINEWFQQEDINLDEGLKKFKRGMELVKLCRERLKEIDNKFHDIKKEFSE